MPFKTLLKTKGCVCVLAVACVASSTPLRVAYLADREVFGEFESYLVRLCLVADRGVVDPSVILFGTGANAALEEAALAAGCGVVTACYGVVVACGVASARLRRGYGAAAARSRRGWIAPPMP